MRFTKQLMSKNLRKKDLLRLYYKLFCIAIFGIAFGFVEAIIVIYLRKIPGALEVIKLPLISEFPSELLGIEQAREICTIIMLAIFAWLVGKEKIEKLAVFLWAFAFWDLFYYIFLYFAVGFPDSLLTWDVVFLFPIIWRFPMCAVLIIMLGFMAVSLWIYRDKVKKI